MTGRRVVVVTGSSRGIGQAASAAFAREGAAVVGMARSEQSETADLVRRAGGSFDAVEADFADATAANAQRLIGRVIELHGRVDVLVNNAGIIRRAPAEHYAEADWLEVLNVNLTSPFFLAQSAARWWLEGGREASPPGARLRVVFIASLLSFQGGITVPAYAASKHGIAGLTKALSNEWAGRGINVNAVAPGYIATENTRALRDNAERNAAILARIPEGRWGEPADVAGACVFLASPTANYLNGAVLNVDGGWLGR